MKKTKIFQEAFSDILIPQGFIYKNKTFIRVIGENIVQSLYLESSSPMYSFDLNLAPAATLTYPRGRYLFQTMKREFRGELPLKFNNFSGFPYVTWSTDGYIEAMKEPEADGIRYSPLEYKDGQDPEACIANMQKAAEVFEKDYLPILNATTDFNSYLKFRETYFNDITLFLNKGRMLSPLALSYKAYLDGNSKYGVEYLRNCTKTDFVMTLKRLFEDWECYDLEKFYKMAEESDIELVREFGLDEERIRHFSPSFAERKLDSAKNIIYQDDLGKKYESFWERVYTNDFSDVVEQWADEEKFVLDLIKEAFPKIKLA